MNYWKLRVSPTKFFLRVFGGVFKVKWWGEGERKNQSLAKELGFPLGGRRRKKADDGARTPTAPKAHVQNSRQLGPPWFFFPLFSLLFSLLFRYQKTNKNSSWVLTTRDALRNLTWNGKNSWSVHLCWLQQPWSISTLEPSLLNC